METLIGRVKHYMFHNEENGYSIAKLNIDDQQDVTIVGYFPVLGEDFDYEFTGEWVNHPSYGQQLKITSYKRMSSQSKSGVISYLSSSFFHGIGPKTAEKIVDTFGSDAIQKILDDKKILKEIGLSAVRIEKLYQQLKEHQINEHILVELYSYDLTMKLAMKLIKKYQIATLEKLKENPYRLIDEIEGIGFIKADEIAQKLGIDPHDDRRIKASIQYALQQIAYQNGDCYLTFEELQKITSDVLKETPDIKPMLELLVKDKKVIVEEDRYYLYSIYIQEIEVAAKLLSLSKTAPDFDIEYARTLLDMVEIERNMTYTDAQKEAILTSLQSSVSIITGGPGTGKTTIIDGLLEVYRIYHQLNYKNPQIYEKIGLMAPTGRAAKRMSDLLDLESKTIHRHLGYNYDGMFGYDEHNQLPYELIIIDEASMIDLGLSHKLFQAIKDGCQVVIVGDVDQLPSVGAGQFLSDLIDSSVLPTVRLEQIHRQAKDSKIIRLAQLVNEQNLSQHDLVSDQDVYLYKAHPNQIMHVMKEQIKGALKEGYRLYEDIQVLAPMYKGDLGIDLLNQTLQETFNQNYKDQITYGDKTYRIGDKVIQLSNDPERLIMNGDLGVVKDIRYNASDQPYLVVSFDQHDVTYEKSDLDDLNLAYAMSIHKSQGSEYPIVIIPMVRNFMHMLKKELIYTAITRAKKYLIILGDMHLLIYAANHLSEKRKTTLAKRLNEDLNMIKEEDISPYDFM